MFKEIVKRTLRIPRLVVAESGDGRAMTRQLDSALMSVGFKLSKDALEYFNELNPIIVKDASINILSAVKELVGDNIKHNVYFIDFPENIPDTLEFWTELIKDALQNPRSAGTVAGQLQMGYVNLLDLPKYGKYLHSYEDMVACHEELIPSFKDRITVLHLGNTLTKEVTTLYCSLAGSVIPLNEEDRGLLQRLAEVCLDSSQPDKIPIRENKAIINMVRLENGAGLIADTPTDILRLACALSGGDATLLINTKFKSFPRRIRRALVDALDSIIKDQPAKLADVNQYSERWKRLGERLHVYECNNREHAEDVFAVARGDKKVRSLMGKVELAFSNEDVGKAIFLLSSAPGVFFRSLDRIINAIPDKSVNSLIKTVERIIPKVSARVVLSVRQHLQNRLLPGRARIFANSKGTSWVTEDKRAPLEKTIVEKLFKVFDNDMLGRIEPLKNLVVDEAMSGVAVPLSDKNKASGFAVLPRGSVMPIDCEILRFFMHWKQHHRRTDYDLSAIMLNDNFESLGHLSYTNLRSGVNVHSGDITSAPNGASEFIDINLDKTKCKYVVPSVNIFSGESFEDVEESFFGFMERTYAQKGKPFEARTVRTKSDIRGKGRVALPLVFIRDANGKWYVKWVHMYLNGRPNFNKVEINRLSTSLLMASVVEYDYLSLSYVIDLMKQRADSYSVYKGQKIESPVTFIGLEEPEGLPEGSTVFTLNNLQDLLPA